MNDTYADSDDYHYDSEATMTTTNGELHHAISIWIEKEDTCS